MLYTCSKRPRTFQKKGSKSSGICMLKPTGKRYQSNRRVRQRHACLRSISCSCGPCRTRRSNLLQIVRLEPLPQLSDVFHYALAVVAVKQASNVAYQRIQFAFVAALASSNIVDKGPLFVMCFSGARSKRLCKQWACCEFRIFFD